MNVHKNAAITWRGRLELIRRVCDEHQGVGRAAAAVGVSTRTARKWVERYRQAGVAGLHDRSSRPHHSPTATEPAIALRIKVLRQQHRWTYGQIAEEVGRAHATVARILGRCGLSRRGRLEPPPPVVRYEYREPGALLHVDIKKLGRIRRLGHRITGHHRGQLHGAGWEFAHVAVDDASRVAYVEVCADERQATAARFVRRAVAWFRHRGVRVRRVMTDNGSCYRARRFAQLCRRLLLRHVRTRPYTPRTNGKAERFIQTLLREWAYARPFYTSAERALLLPYWVEHYNCARAHSSLVGQPPMSRLPGGNNLMRLHI